MNKRRSRFPSRLIVITLALARMLWPWRRKPARPRRILVAHHLLLGDTLMLTALLAKLRANHPQAEIVMTTPLAFVPLYAARPYGVHAAPYDPREVSTLLALLRRPRFDLVILPADNRYSWLARALGARWVVAFAGDRPAHKNWPVDELRPYSATPTAWCDTAAELIDGAPPAPYRPDDWAAPPHAPFDLPDTAADARWAVLHVGASTRLKQWAPAHWRTLAERLSARGLTPVWSAGRGEEGLIDAIDPQHRYQSYAGRLDLAQLWRLLAGAALLVAPDTGIPHLGRIVGVPTVTLFGPGSALLCGGGAFWATAPYRAVTVAPFPCRDQHIQYFRQIDWVQRCERLPPACERPLCMEAILPDRVDAAIDALLSWSRA